jgi:predicted thioesterase
MNKLIPLDASARRNLMVEKEHLANELGSGDVKVLATPMMIALMEAAALDAVRDYLDSGWTTVGTRVDVEHLRATPLGASVTAEAVLVKREDRVLEFAVQAWDGLGVIGQGTHRRHLIDEKMFMGSLERKTP